MLTEADAGHTEFTDEVYENESRYPGGEWKAAEESYTDVVRHIFHWISKGLRGVLGFATQCISSINVQTVMFPLHKRMEKKLHHHVSSRVLLGGCGKMMLGNPI